MQRVETVGPFKEGRGPKERGVSGEGESEKEEKGKGEA